MFLIHWDIYILFYSSIQSFNESNYSVKSIQVFKFTYILRDTVLPKLKTNDGSHIENDGKKKNLSSLQLTENYKHENVEKKCHFK